MLPEEAMAIIQSTQGLRSLQLALRVEAELVDEPSRRGLLADSIVRYAPKLEILALYGADQLSYAHLIGTPRLRLLAIDFSAHELADWAAVHELRDDDAARIIAEAPATLHDLVDYLASASAPRELGHAHDRRGTTNELPAAFFTRALLVRPSLAWAS